VPVELGEGQLAEVVQARFAEQRQAEPAGVAAGERFGVVVEVDEQRLAAASLDEAVGVAVEGSGDRLARQVGADGVSQGLAFEVGD
jgi:hypothetical protein